MRSFLALIFLAALAATAAAVAVPEYSDWLLLSAPVAVASLLLWWRAPGPAPTAPAPPPSPHKNAKRLIVDGSNAMFWRENTPRLETLIDVVTQLQRRDFRVGVMFDASAGHVLFGRYLDDAHFADLLGLPDENCFVVPKGTIADQYILKAARAQNARVVTNDRYRDWADQFPEVRKPGFLIKGRYEKGALKFQRLAPPRQKPA